jgi:putative glutamine amidotransferase
MGFLSIVADAGYKTAVDKIKQSGYGSRAFCGGCMLRKPTVAVSADRKLLGHHAYHVVGEKYLLALTQAAQVCPLILPSLVDQIDQATVLENMDGLFLTGAYSNIEPHHYGGEKSYEGNVHDAFRDSSSFSLIKHAIQLQVPVLGVCRGLQEVNVALGGSLHQKVQDISGLNDHRENVDEAIEKQYAVSHPITLQANGLLRSFNPTDRVMVNSLHGQGIARLAADLNVEASADDGLIEAVSLNTPHPFFLAVQWHPEWKVLENTFYQSIFNAFGRACAIRAQQRAKLN